MAEQKEQCSFRITYYAFGGRAAPLRAAASLGGISYEDVFITGAQQKEDKAAGKRRWSGPPEVTVFDKDGKELVTIGQSNACLRYIGKLAGLYPENPVQRALIDECLDSMEDSMNLATPSGSLEAEAKKAARLKLMEPAGFPYWFNKFELRMEENEKRGNKNGYLVGDTVTIADLKAYYGLAFLTSGMLDHIDGNKLLEPCKRLQAFMSKMKEDERIKKFEAEFAERQKANKENKVSSFKVAGKFMPGSL